MRVSSLEESFCPAAILHRLLQRQVLSVELKLVYFADQVVEGSFRHGGRSCQEVNAVVGTGNIRSTVVFHRVLISVHCAHENNGVIYSWGKWSKAFFEMACGTLVREGSDCACDFSGRGLVAANVVN